MSDLVAVNVRELALLYGLLPEPHSTSPTGTVVPLQSSRLPRGNGVPFPLDAGSRHIVFERRLHRDAIGQQQHVYEAEVLLRFSAGDLEALADYDAHPFQLQSRLNRSQAEAARLRTELTQALTAHTAEVAALKQEISRLSLEAAGNAPSLGAARAQI
jgi:hypothetical protein